MRKDVAATRPAMLLNWNSEHSGRHVDQHGLDTRKLDRFARAGPHSDQVAISGGVSMR